MSLSHLIRVIPFFSLLAALVGLSPVARADILFLDLNAGVDEINSAREAAAARGENLIVLPDRSSQQQQIFNHVHALDLGVDSDSSRLLILQKEESRLASLKKTGAAQAKAEEYKKLQQKMEALKAESDAIKASTSTPKLTPELIQAKVKEMAAAGQKITTLVISGHHGSDYFGLFGEITDEDIAHSLGGAPAVTDSLRSLYGLGCYSGTTAEALTWKSLFPNLAVLGGFDGSAPGTNQDSGTRLLKSQLIKEAALVGLANQKGQGAEVSLALAKGIKALPGFSATTAAMCVCDQCVSRMIGMLNLASTSRTCDASTKQGLAGMTTLTAPNAFNPPCDTSHAPLRAFYNQLRNHLQCAKEPGFDFVAHQTSLAFHTLFSKAIWHNLGLYFAADIQKAEKVLRESCPKSARVLGPAGSLQLSRPLLCYPDTTGGGGDLFRIEDGQRFSGELDDCYHSLPAPKKEEREAVNKVLTVFTQALMHKVDCVPDSWVDEARDRSKLEPLPAGCLEGK